MDSGNHVRPYFSAVSSSARHLLQLLKCINFAQKAYVRITERGIYFTTQESLVMQANVLLDKALFTNYNYNPPEAAGETDDDDEPDSIEPFQINLDALLETLQLFGVSESKDRWGGRNNSYGGLTGAISRAGPAAAFSNQVLGVAGLCKISYEQEGSPLCIVLEESGITTTCELNTYEPERMASIPLQKDGIIHKIIMRADWLQDAINELSTTSPTKLTLLASPTSPYFALSSSGPHGSATVEFNKDPQLLEIFQVAYRVVNTYKFSFVKGASRAMSIASKVSIRGDEQGVLCLQFMVETEEGKVTMIDFRFIAHIAEEAEDSEEEDQEDEEEGEEDND